MSVRIDARDGSDGLTVEPRRLRFFATCLSLPLLLSLPPALILRHSAVMHAQANETLVAATIKLSAQIADLQDLNFVASHLAAKDEILNVLNGEAIVRADAVRLFAAMPANIKLLAFDMSQGQVAFAAQYASRADELVVLDALRKSGFTNLDIHARKNLGPIDLAVVQATLPSAGRQ